VFALALDLRPEPQLVSFGIILAIIVLVLMGTTLIWAALLMASLSDQSAPHAYHDHLPESVD
jgi:hypothetical protein